MQSLEKAPMDKDEYIKRIWQRMGNDREEIQVFLVVHGCSFVVRKDKQRYETSIPRPWVDDKEEERIQDRLSNFCQR